MQLFDAVYREYVVRWNAKADVRNLGFPSLPTLDFAKIDLLQRSEVLLWGTNPFPWHVPTPHLSEEELLRMSCGLLGCSKLFSTSGPDTATLLSNLDLPPPGTDDVLAANGLIALQQPHDPDMAASIHKFQGLVQAALAGNTEAAGAPSVPRQPRSAVAARSGSSCLRTARDRAGTSVLPPGSRVPGKFIYAEENALFFDVFNSCVVQRGRTLVPDYNLLERTFNARANSLLDADPSCKTMTIKTVKCVDIHALI